jgi:hypothetical protein
LLRNLMVVAGNSGVQEFLPKLRKFFSHEDEHVRSHARWAAERLLAVSADRHSGPRLDHAPLDLKKES